MPPRRRQRRRRALWLLVGAVALAAILGAGAIVAVDEVRWRATIVYDKATGRLTDIDWLDLVAMLRPGSDVYIEPLARTPNPFQVIESPRRSPVDLEAGERLFRENCAACHGDRAYGGAGGPNLHDRIFRQGRSDWALYRTIARGVPGTPMVGRRLARDDIWRLVSYLDRTLSGTEGEMSAPAVLSLLPVTAEELLAAPDHSDEWLTYSGSYSSKRHSALAMINRDNVKRLRVAWQRQFSTSAVRMEASPIVHGSIMFVTEPPNRVHAIDAATGQVLWTYAHRLPPRLKLCCEAVNRGVAILGNRVFVGTLDAHLVALDARSGKVEWDVPIAPPADGYSITGAPLAVGNMVITGIAGGEFGIRGFIDAYDAASGKRRWRFNTLPAPGEPGSETWDHDPARVRGAPTWLTGSYDPELKLVYWGVGNPSPNFFGGDRSGDNLYSNCVVALDVDSGALRWYFQFTPHDTHDWDSVQIPVLFDAMMGGVERKLLAWANRNAFYYVLDRRTGEFLLGTPFVRQTWADGLDAKGRPQMRPQSAPTREGTLVYPSVAGATNWWSPSYDPAEKLLFVTTMDRGGIFYAMPDQPEDSDGEILAGATTMVPGEDMTVAVKALEVATGRVRWQHIQPPRKIHGDLGGLLSTAGGLVFGSDDEVFFALDAATGAEVWHFAAGAQILAAPVTYQLDGRQYVALLAGRSVIAFTLPPE